MILGILIAGLTVFSWVLVGYIEFVKGEEADCSVVLATFSTIISGIALIVLLCTNSIDGIEQTYVDLMNERNKLVQELNECEEIDLPNAIRDANSFNSRVTARQKQLRGIVINKFVSPAYARIPLIEVQEIEPMEVTRWNSQTEVKEIK